MNTIEQTTKNETLRDAVNNWLDNYSPDEIPGALSDLLNHGCQSGMVSGLIYYRETLAFFENHKEEISRLLCDTMAELGGRSPADIFGDKWDESDPLAMETQNQNLLAWFAFEETARQIANERGIEI